MADLICQPFEINDGTYTLRDAICLTQAQWDAITPEQLEAMQQMRLSQIMLETDCPYLTPKSQRGQENHPGTIPLIAAAVAQHL
jgi:Tat protein secretion system quality control protein TatD with DNase activity